MAFVSPWYDRWRYTAPYILNFTYPTPTPTVTPTPTPAPAVQFSNVGVANYSPNNTWIVWDTQIPATSKVAYGLSANNLSSVTLENMQYTTSHQVTLTGLQRNTRYYYKVFSRNVSGVEYSSTVYSFRTKNR